MYQMKYYQMNWLLGQPEGRRQLKAARIGMSKSGSIRFLAEIVEPRTRLQALQVTLKRYLLGLMSSHNLKA
jgi:hypothetical protein